MHIDIDFVKNILKQDFFFDSKKKFTIDQVMIAKLQMLETFLSFLDVIILENRLHCIDFVILS